MDVANIDPLTPRRSGSIERRNLCYLPNRRTKEPMLDIESEKILKGGRFQLDGTAKVSLGSVKVLDEKIAPQYGPGQIITSGMSRVDYVTSGIGFAVKIESVDNSAWQLHGYDLNVDKLSTY